MNSSCEIILLSGTHPKFFFFWAWESFRARKRRMYLVHPNRQISRDPCNENRFGAWRPLPGIVRCATSHFTRITMGSKHQIVYIRYIIISIWTSNQDRISTIVSLHTSVLPRQKHDATFAAEQKNMNPFGSMRDECELATRFSSWNLRCKGNKLPNCAIPPNQLKL